MQGKDELGRGLWKLLGEGPHGGLPWRGGLAAGRQQAEEEQEHRSLLLPRLWLQQ